MRKLTQVLPVVMDIPSKCTCITAFPSTKGQQGGAPGAITHSAPGSALEESLVDVCTYFSWIYSWNAVAGSQSTCMLDLIRKYQAVFQSDLNMLLLAARYDSSRCTTFLSTVFIINPLFLGVRWYPTVVLICIFLIAKEVGNIFTCFLVIQISSLI